MSQNQPAHSEEKRLAALRRYSILDTLPEVAFDELNRLALQISGASSSVISFLDADRVWFKSRIAFEYPELPRADWFCAWTCHGTEILEVPDTALDPRFRGLKVVLEEPHVRAYYGCPIVTLDGHAIGSLGVAFWQPTRLAPGVLETLRIAARQVMTQLELRRHLVQLSRIFEEQRRAEDALRTTEAFFQALVESLPQRIIRKDKDGRFTFASRNFCSELGRSLDEICGRTDFDFFPEELARKYQHDDQQVMATRQILDVVEEHLRNDGSKGFVQVVKTPLIDARGEVAGVQGIFWDVTEQRRLEQALAHERDLLKALLDHIPDRIFFKDSQSRFIRCSSSMFSSLGFKSPEEVIGKTDFDYYPQEQAQGFFDEEQRIITTGQPLINKIQNHGSLSGEEVWSSVTKVPIYNHRGLITGVIGLSRDITKLKVAEQALRKAEENYRNIVENSVEGFFQTSADGHYLAANRALARLYGYSSAEELMAAMTDIQHELYVDPNRREEFRRLMRERREVTGFESQIYRKDGGVIWISESARSVLDEAGNLKFYEGSVEDITARKLADKAREAAAKAELESAQVKAQFLANMSHEFRTPLNAIIGNASLLMAESPGPEQRELLEPISHSAEALHHLINDILDFSRIEASKLVLESIDFDLRQLTESSAEMVAQSARKQANELICWLDPAIPSIVKGDPARLRQILANLLSNAAKFTQRGQIHLSVRLLSDSPAGVSVRFDVSDTGIGIDEKSKPIIFQAFTQADGSTTRRFGGTGLGLTISRELVLLMGGRIGFDSQLGKGSTFWFEISFPKGPAEPSAQALRHRLQGVRIAIVDDNPAALEAARSYLESAGATVETFTGSVEATAALATRTGEEHFDVLLVDMEMTEMDGLSFLRKLRAEGKLETTQVVLLTPLGQRLERPVMTANNIGTCIAKPMRFGRLIAAVHALMNPRSPEALAELDPPIKSVRASLPQGLRVLVAEDNPLNQQVALRMLRWLKATAKVAANGMEVLDELRSTPYDIVLMDCQMPEMDGYEAARKIRELSAQVPSPLKSQPVLIAVTANAMAGDREQCIEAGMSDYLSKPLTLEALAATLERNVHPSGVRAASSTGTTEATSKPASSVENLDMDLSVINGLRDLREPGQPDPLTQLVELFLRDSAIRLQQLESAVAQGEGLKAGAAAHSLKGSASNLGARRLAVLSGQIEKEAKGGSLDAVKPLVELLAEEFRKVQAFLQLEVQR